MAITNGNPKWQSVPQKVFVRQDFRTYLGLTMVSHGGVEGEGETVFL
jgi:hypothetical protein